MNYTQPNNPDHQDTPLLWLNSALILARGMSFALENNQGIVIKLTGDMKCPDPEDPSKFTEGDKVIIYKDDPQIRIVKFDGVEEEGVVVWVLNESDDDLEGFHKA